MRKSYEYVLGENYYDCGISCIMTILMYYGIKTSRQKIINKLKKTENGYTAYDLLTIAKTYGLSGMGVKQSIDKLNKMPVIAHTIKDKNMFHFIVILENKIKNKTLKIMDPSEGIKTITYEEFNKITTNIFLIFDGKKKKKTKNTRFKKEIIRIYQNNKRIILKSIFLSIVYIVLSIIFSYYLKLMLQSYNKNSLLIKIFGSFLIILIIKNSLGYFKNKLTYKISKKIDKDITNQVTNHILFLPYQYFISKTTGELVTIIEDIENFKQIVTKIIILSLVDFILIFIVLLYLVIFNFNIAIFLIILIVLLLIITKRYQYIFNDDYISLKRNKIDYTSLLINYFTSFETIKNLNIATQLYKNLSNKYEKSLDSDEKYNLNYYKYSINQAFLADIFYIIIILICLLLVSVNSFNILNVVLFSSIYYLVLGLINNINESISMYKVYETSVDRVLDCLEVSPEKFNKTNFTKINNITFQSISYKLNDLEILKSISFICNKNDKIFITGESGLGKSTLMKLLLKYYKFEEGKILIDGLDINDLDLSFIRDNITYIGQNESIFPGTILDNFKLVSNDMNLIEKASKTTLLVEFFAKNNIDYNYVLEESGSNLSGGERKKIILSRGLLRFNNVLILDEVFNEISISEERKILQNIFNEYKDKIIIVISHRDNNDDLFNKKYKLKGDGKLYEVK